MCKITTSESIFLSRKDISRRIVFYEWKWMGGKVFTNMGRV